MYESLYTGIQNAFAISQSLRQSGEFETPISYISRMPREVLIKRVNAVIDNELTPKQRRVIRGVLEGKKQIQIAEEMGLNKSSVCRTYKRAVGRLQRFLKY